MLAEVRQNKAQASGSADSKEKESPRRARKGAGSLAGLVSTGVKTTASPGISGGALGHSSEEILGALGLDTVVRSSDAAGSDAVRKAGNREMLVFAQSDASTLRRQEALFRQALAWIAQVPEDRREGVRQSVLVYARNVRSWQMQTQEQEAAFLAAQDKDQQARARFMLAEKALTEAAQQKRFGFFGLLFRGRRAQAQACMEQASEHSAAVREALNEQGLAIHRYMRFQSEWRRSIEEMMAFVAEQSGFGEK